MLVNPNFERVADALRAHGVPAEGAALRNAEAHAKKELDTDTTVHATSDASRGWLYFELVLKHAGIARDAAPRPRCATSPPTTRSTTYGRWYRTRCPRRSRDCARGGAAWQDREARPAVLHPRPDRAAADPATTLHVGDLYHVDVRGARAAGIEAWLFDVAGLYPEADCPRVGSLTELADRLAGGLAS